MTKRRKMAIAAFAVLAVLALVAVPVSRLAGGGNAAGGGAQQQGQQEQQGGQESGARGVQDGEGEDEAETGGGAGAEQQAWTPSTGATSLVRDKVSGSSNIDSAGQGAWDNFNKTVTSMLFVAGKDPDAAQVSVSDVTATATGTDGESRAVRYVSIDGTWHVFEFTASGTCTHYELSDKVAGVNATAEEAQGDLPTDGVGEI